MFQRVRKTGGGPMLGRALGMIMILTAVAIATNLAINFGQFVADKIPNVNLAASLECSPTVTSRLDGGHRSQSQVRRRQRWLGLRRLRHEQDPSRRARREPGDVARRRAPPGDLGAAPEFTETEDWFNTPGGQPLTLSSLRGRVVLVDFWTYTCINCIRTLPYLKAWNAAYAKDGLTIVGVETPEFGFEKKASNVADAIGQFGLRYPVVQDNNMGTWNAYGNEYWPADYLIDAKGNVRYKTLRRGRLRQDRNRDQGAARRSRPSGRRHESPDRRRHAFGNRDARDLHGNAAGEGWINGPHAGTHDYGPPPSGALALNDFAYSGTWRSANSPPKRSPAPASTSSSRRSACISC